MAKYYTGLKYHNDTTEKHQISQEEKLFLRRLQMELNAQDNVCQADPRFWVIKGSEKIFDVEEPDGELLLYDNDTVADSLEEAFEFIRDNLLDTINNSESCLFKVVYKNDSIKIMRDGYYISSLYDMESVATWLETVGCQLFSSCTYKIVPKIYEDTMFLTQIDAENHLRTNYYHYSEDAHTYAMTAWRSPRVEKLLEILRKVEW